MVFHVKILHRIFHYIYIKCIARFFFLSVHSRRNCILSVDMKPQEEFIQTEEWTSVKSISETKTDAQEDERIEVDDSES